MGRRKKKLWTHLELDSPFLDAHLGAFSHLAADLTFDFEGGHHAAEGKIRVGSGAGSFDAAVDMGAEDAAPHMRLEAHLKDFPLETLSDGATGVAHADVHLAGPHTALMADIILRAEDFENAVVQADNIVLSLKSAALLEGGALECTADKGVETLRVDAEGAWSAENLQLKNVHLKTQGLDLTGFAAYAWKAATPLEGLEGQLQGAFSDFSGLSAFLKGFQSSEGYDSGEAGKQQGMLQIMQKANGPLSAHFSGVALRFNQVLLDALDGRLRWDWRHGKFPQGRIHARGITWGDTLLISHIEAFSKAEGGERLGWQVGFGMPLGGEGVVNGTLHTQSASWKIDVAKAQFSQEAIGQVPALTMRLGAPWTLSLQSGHWHLAPATLHVNSGVLTLEEGADEKIRIQIQHLPLTLGMLVRDTFPWRGGMSGTVTSTRSEGRDLLWDMHISGLVNSEALNVTTKESDALTLRSKGRWHGGVIKGTISVDDPHAPLGQLILDVPEDVFHEQGGSVGTGSLILKIQGEIAPLVQIFLGSSGRLEGEVSSQVTMTLRRAIEGWVPTLEGHFDLEKGLLEDYNTNLSLSDFEAHLKAKDAHIQGVLKGKDRGGGGLAVQLTAGWPKAKIFHLEADMDLLKFNAMDTDTLSVTASGRLTARLDLPAAVGAPALMLKGDLDILKGGYALEQIQMHDFETLNVTRVNVPLGIHDDLSGEESAGFLAGLDLNLKIPNTLTIEGFGMTSLWGGTLHVLGTTFAPVLQGTLKLTKGTFSIMARDLSLKEGMIYFHEQTPINPEISIKGTMTGGGVSTSVALVGSANAPRLELSSTPPMSESEIVSHILFGTNSGDISPLQAILLANTLQEIHSGHFGGGLFENLRKATGLDDLSFSTNEEGQGMVGIGKYLGNGVYMSIKGGLGLGEAAVEIPVSEHISVETAVGTHGNTGIGVNWTWAY